MAAYTRSLLEPMVAHVAELEGTIRTQAEVLGPTPGTAGDGRGPPTCPKCHRRRSHIDADPGAV